MPRRAPRDPISGRRLPHPRKASIRALTADRDVRDIYELLRREQQSLRARRLPAMPDEDIASFAHEFVRQHR